MLCKMPANCRSWLGYQPQVLGLILTDNGFKLSDYDSVPINGINCLWLRLSGAVPFFESTEFRTIDCLASNKQAIINQLVRAHHHVPHSRLFIYKAIKAKRAEEPLPLH
jgi:hypothetical protein